MISSIVKKRTVTQVDIHTLIYDPDFKPYYMPVQKLLHYSQKTGYVYLTWRMLFPKTE